MAKITPVITNSIERKPGKMFVASRAKKAR